MSRYQDLISRPARSHRVNVDVQYRLSRDEVRRAFLFYVTVLQPDEYLHVTPQVETLSHNLFVVLWLRGSDFLIPRGIEEPPLLPEPSADALAYAERCTARLWTSKRIMEKPDGNLPSVRNKQSK